MARLTSWQMQARNRKAKQELADRQKVTIRCAHCPQHGAGRGFKFTGPVSEGRRLFEEHRATVHPELPSLAAAKLEQAKKRRVRTPQQAIRANSYQQRREFLTPDELLQREILRRETRTDLQPLDAKIEAA